MVFVLDTFELDGTVFIRDVAVDFTFAACSGDVDFSVTHVLSKVSTGVGLQGHRRTKYNPIEIAGLLSYLEEQSRGETSGEWVDTMVSRWVAMRFIERLSIDNKLPFVGRSINVDELFEAVGKEVESVNGQVG